MSGLKLPHIDDVVAIDIHTMPRNPAACMGVTVTVHSIDLSRPRKARVAYSRRRGAPTGWLDPSGWPPARPHGFARKI